MNRAKHFLGLSMTMILVGALLGAAILGETSKRIPPGPFIVLLGAPGAGKSTHGSIISEQHNVPLVSAAEVLEEKIVRGSLAYGSAAQKDAATKRTRKRKATLERLRAGELVDDDDLNEMVVNHISDEEFRNGFVIDGYPNSSNQAEFLQSFLESNGVTDLLVLYLDVPDEVSLARMEDRGRADDRHGFGEERLRQFRAGITELLKFYVDAPVYTIDTTQDQSEVAGRIEAIIKDLPRGE